MNVPYSSKTLWAGCVKATIEAILIGDNLVEVWTCVGGEVPMRHRGTIGEMERRADLWLSNRKQEGFEEQLPTYTPHIWKP